MLLRARCCAPPRGERARTRTPAAAHPPGTPPLAAPRRRAAHAAAALPTAASASARRWRIGAHRAATAIVDPSEPPSPVAPPAPAAATPDVQGEVLREVAVLGVPILGAALSEPLLTLVDTFCVGRTDGTLALAALAVNCGFFNFLSNSAAFLVTATTNCVAAALGSADADAPAPNAQRSAAAADRASVLMGHAIVLALGMGTATAASIAMAPDALLSLYGVAPGTPLNAAARVYLLIRTLSVPSMFLMFVAVGASLGAGNALAPTFGIVAAAVVNLIGDTALVLRCGAGLAGAAAATAAASWTGTALVLHSLRRLIVPRFSWPRLNDVAPLLAVSGALLLTQVTNSIVYSYTTKTAALAGTTPAAAHQIILQMWWLLSYFPVPLYLAAQSLLGRDLGRGDIARASASIRVLATLGGVLALLLGLANAALPAAFPGAFTHDAAVVAALAAVVPAACVAQAGATLNTTLEGIFAGAGRLRYVASVSLVSSATAIVAMRAMAARGMGLGAAWYGLCAFEAVRLSCHALSWRAFAADVREGRARGAVPPPQRDECAAQPV